MGNTKFVKIFRGDIKNIYITHEDVKRVEETLEDYENYYKATGKVNYILRRSGLTKEDFRDYLKNKTKYEERLKLYKKNSVRGNNLAVDTIRQELWDKREEFLKRLFFGDTKKEAVKGLWVTNRSAEINRLIRELEKEGYFVRDMQVVYTMQDLAEDEGYSLEMLHKKFPQYSIKDIKKNLDLHGVLYTDKKLRGKIKVG